MFKYLLFDLDNTLYSCRYGLEDHVKCRIREFAAGVLGVSPEDAWRERMSLARKYGTSLDWLMTEKGFTDAETYLAAAHPEGEADGLPPDPELRAFLLDIPVPKAILTNSTREHTELILSKLGLNGIFTRIFDIRQCGFVGKPRREVFDNALRILKTVAADVLFIDDNPFFVEGFIAMGGNGLLLDENDVHKNNALPRIRNVKELAAAV
jgi:putative hydrolase of the HAD superfamily